MRLPPQTIPADVLAAADALYRRPRTTKPEPGHKIHPYLLRGMEIARPNQVWASSTAFCFDQVAFGAGSKTALGRVNPVL